LSNWDLSPSGYTESFGIDAVEHSCMLIDGSGTAHTKSAYVEIAASLAHDVSGIWLLLGGFWENTLPSVLVDIAVGAAASEKVVISNILRDATKGNYRYTTLSFIPLSLKKGQRISARYQCEALSETFGVQVRVQYAGNWADDSLQHAVTYGANTADTGGVEITPSGSLDTKGSWAEITAATERDHEAIMVNCSAGADISRATQSQLIDIGAGASGSEIVIVSNLPVSMHTQADQISPQAMGAFLLHIKGGTRLSARSQTSATISSTTLDITLVGFS
jgi:hypothetical protein